MIFSAFRTRRLPNAILPARKSHPSHCFYPPTGKLLAIVLIFGTIVLASFSRNLNFISLSAIGNFVATLLPHIFSRGSLSTSYSSFSSHHPILTRRVTPDTLYTILENRRRITKSVINNTLISACPSAHPFTARLLASWNAIHGVQQIIIAHFFSSAEDIHRSLSLIDDVDKPGQIIYVAIETEKESSRYLAPSPTPRGRVRRWPRTRAYNLAAHIASGHNLFFVDCRTVISPDALISHPIIDGSIFVRVGDAPFDGSGVRPVQMVYVQRQAFFAAHGMDERIDIPGFDMADFVERATRKTSQAWRFMRTEASQDMPNLEDAPLVIDAAADRTHADPVSAHYPELVLYVTALSRGEMPPWRGELPNGDPSVISLHDIKFRMLRTQADPFDDAQKFRLRVGRPRRVDFRLWLYTFMPDATSESLVNALPHNVRASVVLQAHRKLLHDHYGLPWQLLDIIETPDKTNFIPQGNASTVDITTLTSSTDGVEELLQEPSVHLLKTWRYSPILFNVVWRKAKLLVVNIRANTAMELLRSSTWALALAMAHSRTLILTGDLRETPVVHLLDVSKMRGMLKREYHVNIDILAREQKFLCALEDQIAHSCWPEDDVHNLWAVSRVRAGIIDVNEDPSRHMLVQILAKEVLSWDDKTNTTDWFRQLEEHAFACLSVSQRVTNIVQSLSIYNLHNRTAFWVTRSIRHEGEVRTLVARYQNYRGVLKTSSEIHPLVILSDDFEVESEGERGRKADAYYSMADLWIVLQCEKIVFDTDRVPSTWKGIDKGLTEWRRLNGVGTGENEQSVIHIQSPDIKGFSYHEMILNVQAVVRADNVVGRVILLP